MSKSVGRSVTRVDAYDKATGRARYMDDLCGREALVVKKRIYYISISQISQLKIKQMAQCLKGLSIHI